MRITAQEAIARLQGTMRRAKGEVTLLRSIKQTRRDRIFLFNRGGSTIVSPADSDLPSVLAEFETTDDTPPALNYWLTGLAKEVKWYQEEGRKTAAKVAKAPAKANAAPVIVEPLLGNIKWGQGAPYNNNIRLTNPTTGKKDPCYTGCVATAMAMVLFYWSKQGRRRGCKATPAYTTTTKKYSVAALPPIEMFDFERMTDAKPTTATSKTAVATLMEYMGKSVYMDYTSSVSWALITKTVTALKNQVNIPTTERVECKYVTTPRFSARIIAELQLGRPVVMFGGGHCFICDGYDSSTDLFHFNWGWNGLCDGWFAMTALNPDDKNYNASKNAIVGICPSILGDVNGDGKINMADVSASIKAQKEYDIAADVNFDGKVDDTDTQKIINKVLTGKGL